MRMIIDLPDDAVKNIDDIRFLIGGKEDRMLQQEVIKAIKNGVPFNFYIPYETIPSSPCQTCSNHPSNGGSGVCHCTLGTQVIY